jgi:hypothetical protein
LGACCLGGEDGESYCDQGGDDCDSGTTAHVFSLWSFEFLTLYVGGLVEEDLQ